MLRAPLLHFLAIGGALLALRPWWSPADARPRIVLDAGDVARLRETWTTVHGAPPGPAAEEALVASAVDEEILWREALARGFDRSDEAVRERLVRLGGFVGEETAQDREALEGEARRLGLERSDLVVRRHLVEMMRLAAGSLGPGDLPSEAELEAFLAEHAAEFAEPARLRLTHVYLSADARGPRAAADAGALLARLRQTGAGPEEAAALGDAFIRGAEVDAPPADVDRVFGPGFADAATAAPVGSWAGPIRSSYGLHLVWLRAREPAHVPSLDAVRGRVLHRWLRARSDERERETMAALRARYEVVVARR